MMDFLLRFTILSGAACVVVLLAGLVYLLLAGQRFNERVMQLVYWLLLACLIGPVSFVVFAAMQAAYMGD